MSRLTVDLSDQQHQSLKARAAIQGKTIRQYAIERLFDYSADETDAYDALAALMRDRISEGLAGAVSSKSFTSIVDEELRGGRVG
jgi:Antitoxin ParD